MNDKINTYFVIIEKAAVLDMLAPAIECAAHPPVDNTNNHFTEVDGSVWGHVSTNGGNKYFTVRKILPYITSFRTQKSVECDLRVNDTHKFLLRSFCPSYECLGDFHSHPYIDQQDSEIDKFNISFSDRDKQFFRSNPQFPLGLVVSICKSDNESIFTEKADYSDKFDDDVNSTIGFQLSNAKVYIKAHVTRINEAKSVSFVKDNRVILSISGVQGLNNPLSSYESHMFDVFPRKKQRHTRR